MDGQYTCLNIGTHMNDVLCRNVNLCWDPMHRIELANKDATKASETKYIEGTVSIIQEAFSLFKHGNNFELLYSEKESCEVFYTPKIFKDMKFVAYSSTVFSSFISDFKALASCLEKIADANNLRKKMLNVKFLLNMSLLSDVTKIMSSASKLVQISNNLPWEYFDSIEQVFDQIFIMFEQLNAIKIDLENDQENVECLLNSVNQSMFKNFRSATEIFDKSTYQGILISKNVPGRKSIIDVFLRMLEFGTRYVTALRDNMKSRFDCDTFRFCRKFKIMFDTFLFYPSNNHPIDEPLVDIDTFSNFVSDIPFVSEVKEEQQTLLFQMRIMRKKLLDLVSHMRAAEKNYELFQPKNILKFTYSNLEGHSLLVVKQFMSSVVAFPISEAIVESWGSVIDNVMADKIAFKESNGSDITDYTEKIVFIKLVGPAPGVHYNRNLFKRALVLMYDGSDYAKHFVAKSRIGYTSKVVERITGGEADDFMFL